MTIDLVNWLYANTSVQKDEAQSFVRWLTDEQKEIVETAIEEAYQMGHADAMAMLEKAE